MENNIAVKSFISTFSTPVQFPLILFSIWAVVTLIDIWLVRKYCLSSRNIKLEPLFDVKFQSSSLLGFILSGLFVWVTAQLSLFKMIAQFVRLPFFLTLWCHYPIAQFFERFFKVYFQSSETLNVVLIFHFLTIDTTFMCCFYYWLSICFEKIRSQESLAVLSQGVCFIYLLVWCADYSVSKRACNNGLKDFLSCCTKYLMNLFNLLIRLPQAKFLYLSFHDCLEQQISPVLLLALLLSIFVDIFKGLLDIFLFVRCQLLPSKRWWSLWESVLLFGLRILRLFILGLSVSVGKVVLYIAMKRVLLRILSFCSLLSFLVCLLEKGLLERGEGEVDHNESVCCLPVRADAS